MQKQEQSPVKRRSLRPVAFAAVAFSTISVISCIITLPIIYSHIQNVQSFMQNEVDFCKTRAREMWKEMVQLQAVVDIPPSTPNSRLKRQYSADQIHGSDVNSSPSSGGSCCQCQIGPPGPPGPPGRDGRPG
ncbi:unnamed protein product [Anisakis simplex]|uniref:Col_cuticle_N domain-containing protein n=1 Tax=Anisakis simplex TaxID=6269 RepID=A0A0M3K1Q4_ANISI|nr:unnamed protein product [Anisakis simplex]